tara:strand:- start:718 stop:1437 length:720 start_codon:yes stop_codon:yes gene_type:complete
MLASGVNFALHYQFSRLKFSSIWTDTEFKSYLFFIISVVSLLVAILFFKGIYIDLFLCVRDVLFTTIALITGTGFATVDYEQWPIVCQAILFCLFFTGGCAGSTTGGIKIIRLVIFCKFAYQQINQLIHPQAILNLKVNRQMVKDNVIKGVLGFFILYALSFMIGTVLMASTGLDLISASAATATCLGNIGPAFGSIGPTDNFADISDFGKWVLAFLMLLGRLELFTVLVLFTPTFWRD